MICINVESATPTIVHGQWKLSRTYTMHCKGPIPSPGFYILSCDLVFALDIILVPGVVSTSANGHTDDLAVFFTKPSNSKTWLDLSEQTGMSGDWKEIIIINIIIGLGDSIWKTEWMWCLQGQLRARQGNAGQGRLMSRQGNKANSCGKARQGQD